MKTETRKVLTEKSDYDLTLEELQSLFYEANRKIHKTIRCADEREYLQCIFIVSPYVFKMWKHYSNDVMNWEGARIQCDRELTGKEIFYC